MNPHRVDVDITSIRQRPNFGEFPRHSTYFFDVTSLIEKSTSCPCTFFDVILLVEKSMLFPCTFFGEISLVEKSTLFPRTLFDMISMVKKSTLFPRTFIGVILLVKKSTLFPLTFFRDYFSGRNIHIVSTMECISMFLLIFFDVFVS